MYGLFRFFQKIIVGQSSATILAIFCCHLVYSAFLESPLSEEEQERTPPSRCSGSCTYCTKNPGGSRGLVSKLGKVGRGGVADSASTTCHKNATRLSNWITARLSHRPSSLFGQGRPPAPPEPDCRGRCRLMKERRRMWLKSGK